MNRIHASQPMNHMPRRFGQLSRRLACVALLAGVSFAAHAETLVDAARRQIGVTRYYDPAYRPLPYPGGDVPMDRGVCTDVVVRAYRRFGVDLQVLVHDDMRRAWAEYPNKWGLKAPDRNIDHRRVPNLETFFTRHGQRLPVSNEAKDYLPGDIVTWRLPNGAPHVGLVSDQKSLFGTPLVIHNIGSGTVQENVLFDYRINGHYRYAVPAGRRP
jgi:uncharacterized protein